MADYYLDFVGLNTFIYEPCGFDGSEISEATSSGDTAYVQPSYIGIYDASGQTLVGESSLIKYKNNNFSHYLATTASHFPALMLHRNGPYGWPAFKSARLSHNPLMRKQRQENKMSVMLKPKPITITSNGTSRMVFPRKGTLKVFDEPSVVSRHHPLEYSFGFVEEVVSSYGSETTRMRRLRVKHSFDNLIYNFTNNQINSTCNKPNSHLDLLSSDMEEVPASLQEYQGITGMYLEGAIDDIDSPIDEFLYLKYRTTIYPPERYTFKEYTRGRTTFSFSWRDSLSSRQVYGGDNFGRPVDSFSSSMWPLDVDPQWQNFTQPYVKYMGIDATSSFGILWNHYAQAAQNISSSNYWDNIDDKVRPAPIYARRHLHWHSASVVAPTGLFGVTSSTDADSSGLDQFGGEAYWDAPSQAPSSSGPFYDSYSDYASEIRLVGKDYSIIPEFKISDFVEEYESRSIDNPIKAFLSITGGLAGKTDSSVKEFYDIYTTTDLMKSFDFLVDDHEEFAEPSTIAISCKAISKFLPYNGFYPVQRTVQMAEQFYNSYKDNISYSSASVGFSFGSASYSFSTPLRHSAQNILAPLYAPGVLYNAIKSGVACDFPIVAGPLTGAVSHFGFLQIEDFDERIPFEALVHPHKYLANKILPFMETHESSSTYTTASWDGGGDHLYAKMANNFLGEVPNFFLDGASNTAIASKKNKSIHFVRENTTYAMRVEMRRSMNQPRTFITNSAHVLYRPPQDIDNGTLKETLTMYSRPSAFGPPTLGTVYTSGHNADDPYELGGIYKSGTAIYSNYAKGLNYPFTPPYYHGRAWADIVYKSGNKNGRVSLEEIMASASVTYHRFDHTAYSNNGFVSASTWDRQFYPQAITKINRNAMQLSASLNLFGLAQVGKFNENSIENRENSRWVIQTKFETPILNFSSYEDKTTLTMPSGAVSSSVPRGMWHQFGKIPTNKEGIYLQVKDIPSSWNAAHGRPKITHPTASLADLVGFNTDSVKLGRIAESVTVKEAVIMIPFKDNKGSKEFFKIEESETLARLTINRAKKLAEGHKDEQPNVATVAGLKRPDRSIVRMVKKMQEFVIPPQMDFISYPETIAPFAMYIFDFEYTFTREDLQYIWQGLMPPSAQTHKKLKRTVRHKLKDNALLSGQDLIDNPNIKWLVFKVKQRANTNYFDKLYLQAGESNFDKQAPQGTLSAIPQSTIIENKPNRAISYNWPYDFFSFVELIKIDASVALRGTEKEEEEEIKITRNKEAIKRSLVNVSKINRPFRGE